VVSGHLDAWISGLVARLGVPGRCSKARVEDDRVVEVSSVLDKASVASEYSGRLCAIGNDYDDLPLLSAAEIGIAYGAAHASADCLLDIATHAIYDPTRLCRLLSAW
jgi:soluble P-type ATPase